MTNHECARRLDELDRLLNDPDVAMDPSRVWSLLADLSHHDGPGTTGHETHLTTGLAQAARPTALPAAPRTPAPGAAPTQMPGEARGGQRQGHHQGPRGGRLPISLAPHLG